MAKKKLEVVIAGDSKGGEQAFASLDGAADGAESKIAGLGAKLGPIALGAGAAAGAALWAGFNETMADASIVTGFENRLGVSPEVAAQMGKATSAAWADGFGESKAEVAAAAEAINTAFGDSISYDPAALQPLIGQATALAETFDIDVNEAMMAAGAMLKNGLVADGQEGLDVLTAGLQGLAPAVREEVIAATNEYSKHFGALGMSAEETMRLFRSADGVIGVDKLGDAMKELTIRGTDMSESSAKAFGWMGLSAEDMSAKLLAGGDTARGALDEIVDGLLGIDDPTHQANAAIALFGTPLEDLGTDQIPAFLKSLDGMGGGLGDVSGKAQEMADNLNSGPMATIERFKRGALQGLADFIGGTVIPGIERLVAVFQQGGLSGVVDLIASKWAEAWPTVQATLVTFATNVGTWIAEQAPIFAEKLVGWGKAFVEWLLPNIPPLLVQLGQMLGAVGGWILETGLPLLVSKLTEWGTAFVKWVGPLIPPLLGELGALLLRLGGWILGEALPEIASNVVQWAAAFFRWVGEEALPKLLVEIVKLSDAISGWFTGTAIPMAKEKAGELVEGIVNWFRDLPDKILSAIGDLSRLLYNAGRDILQGLIDGVESMIGSLTSKLGGITDMIPISKGPPAVDRVLLEPTGRMIMGGLISGIDAGEDLLRKKLGDVTRVIPAAASAPLSVPSSARSLTSGGSGGDVYLTVQVSGSVLAERELVDVVADGLEKARRRNGGRSMVVGR